MPRPPALTVLERSPHTQHTADFPSTNRSRSDYPSSFPSDFPGGELPSSDLPCCDLLSADLPRYIDDWLLDCQLRQHSRSTIQCRRNFLEKLLWFLRNRQLRRVGTKELRGFLLYLSEGHNDPGGRFGNPKLTTPLKPVSVHDYYRVLRAFFNWLCTEEVLRDSPMRRMKPPVVRHEQKQPIAAAQITALLRAAKRSREARRNEAILLLLLDTGLRASELCSLKVGDIDLATRSFKVTGKGNKTRTCYFGRSTMKALVAYLRVRRAKADQPLFPARSGEALCANSLRLLTDRLAQSAGLSKNGISPHAFRRTFAVWLLRNGGNIFALQAMLGHSDLQMVRRYCAIADADVEAQHQQFSPVDRLRNL